MRLRSHTSSPPILWAGISIFLSLQICLHLPHFANASSELDSLSPQLQDSLLKMCHANPGISPFCRILVPVTPPISECRPLPPRDDTANISDIPLSSLLIKGSLEMRTQRSRHTPNSSAIFILGNTGSGKTTVTQILAGDIHRLHATRTPKKNLVIIDDNARIGQPTTVSKTLIPEYVVHPESRVAFWDCPGFDDNRGPEVDIAAMYFVKDAISLTQDAKFLFTVTHSSVRVGNDRLDFDLMVTHAIRLVKNVSQFRDSTGLIVTKVGSYSQTTGEYMTDNEILEQILEFLETYVETKRSQLERSEDPEERNIFQRKIDFVEGILGRNGGTGYVKIAFVRSPVNCGSLADMPSITKTRGNIVEMYSRNLTYSEVTPDDFRFALKANTLLQVKTVFIPESVNKIRETFAEMKSQLEAGFDAEFYQTLDISGAQSLDNLNATKNALANFLDDLTNEGDTVEPAVDQLFNSLPFHLNTTTKTELVELDRQIRFLTHVTNDEDSVPIPELVNLQPMFNFLVFVGHLQEYYTFCWDAEVALDQRQTLLMKLSTRVNISEELEPREMLLLLMENKLMVNSSRLLFLWERVGAKDQQFVKDLTLRSLHKINCSEVETPSPCDIHDSRVFEEIVAEGIENINEQIARALEQEVDMSRVMVVLGNKDGDKLPALQFLTRYLSELYAGYTENGDLTVTDALEDNLEVEEIRRCSLYPQLFYRTDTGIPVWNAPGFEEHSDPKLNLVAMSLLKHVLDSVTSAVFLVTTPHSDLEVDADPRNLDLLDHHLQKLLSGGDPEKFLGSYGLVVTNVPSFYPETGEFLSDSEIFYQTKIASVLPRVLLRTPLKCGSLNNMEDVRVSRSKLIDMYSSLEYATVSPDDFEMSVQSSTIDHVKAVIIPNLAGESDRIFGEMVEQGKAEFSRKFYATLHSQEIYSFVILIETQEAVETLQRSASPQSTDNSTKLDIHFKEMVREMKAELRISVNGSLVDQLEQLGKQLQFYIRVSNDQITIPSPLDALQSFSEHLEQLRDFYSFCMETKETLERKQGMLVKLSKRVNFSEEVNNGGALNFLRDNKLVHVPERITSLWGEVEPEEKTFLEDKIMKALQEVQCPEYKFPEGDVEMDTRTLKSLISEEKAVIDQQLAQLKDLRDYSSQTNETYGTFLLGKSSSRNIPLAQILMGKEDTLYAYYNENGDLLLGDREDANDTSKCTNVPFLINSVWSGWTIWNCPGLNGSHEPEVDIGTNYLLRYAMDSVNGANFILTFSGSSLQENNDNWADIDLVTSHVVQLLQDSSSFLNSIGLVLTDVPSFSEATGAFLSDQDISTKIRMYLERYKRALEARLDNAVWGNERDIVIKKKELIEGLLDLDTPPFTFIRAPTRCGEFKDLPGFTSTWMLIINIQLNFSTVTPQDFRYVLNDQTVEHVNRALLPESLEKVRLSFLQIVADIRSEFRSNFYEHLEINSTESVKFLNRTVNLLREKSREMMQASHAGDTIGVIQTLGQIFDDFYLSSDLELNQTGIAALKSNLEDVRFYVEVTNGQIVLGIPDIVSLDSWKQFQLQLDGLLVFYEFCGETVQELDRKQAMLVQVSKKVNIPEEVEAGNVLSLLSNNKLKSVSRSIFTLWGIMEPEDKKHLEKAVLQSLNDMNCKTVPAPENTLLRRHDLDRMLSRAIAHFADLKANDFNATMAKQAISKQATFVLGNNGRDKTLAVQVLTGNLAELYAGYGENGDIIVGYDSPRSNFERSRFGPEPRHSPDTLGEYFWNAPGFEEPDAPEIRVVAVFQLKHMLDLAAQVKFILTVDYNMDLEHFDMLVGHTIQLLKNGTKWRDSVALVVTNVPNFSNLTGEYVTDEQHVARIDTFLREYVNWKTEELEEIAEQEERSKLQNKMAFVQDLLSESDQNGKISFVRLPPKCGSLEDQPSILETRRQLAALQNGLVWSSTSEGDFQYTLSRDTITFVKAAISDIASQIDATVASLPSQIERRFESLFYGKLSNKMEDKRRFLNGTVNALERFLERANNSDIPFSLQLTQLYHDLGMNATCSRQFSLAELETRLDFFKEITNRQWSSVSLDLAVVQRLANFTRKVNELQEYYQFFESIKQELEQYSKKVKLTELAIKNKDVTTIENNNVQAFLDRQNLVSVPPQIVASWDRLRQSDQVFLVELVRKSIPKITLKCDISSVDPRKKHLVVSGDKMTLGTILDPSNWPENCTENNIKEMSVFAMESLTIDADIRATGKELWVNIIAPLWEVVAEPNATRKVLLEGITPERTFPPKAGSGGYPGARGEHGISGSHGGNAGSFFGVYETILNGDLLQVSTNGGDGGQGQDGGDGAEGAYGRNAHFSDFPSSHSSRVSYPGGFTYPGVKPGRYYSGEWRHNSDTWYSREGGSGSSGENGGNGGNGGNPGRRGELQILAVKDNLSEIRISRRHGQAGRGGQGGQGGKGGKDGNYYQCIHESSGWRDCYSSRVERTISSGVTGNNGRTGTLPTPSSVVNYPYWRLLLNYRMTFLEHESEMLASFLKTLDSNPKILSLTTTVSLATEVDLLEKKWFAMTHLPVHRKVTMFRGYYDNLPARIIKYLELLPANSLTLQERKALSVIKGAVASKLAALQKGGYKPEVLQTKEDFDMFVGRLNTLKNVSNAELLQEESKQMGDFLKEKMVAVSSSIQEDVHSAVQLAEKVGKEEMGEVLQNLGENVDLFNDVEYLKALFQKGGLIEVKNVLVKSLKYLEKVVRHLTPINTTTGGVMVRNITEFQPTSANLKNQTNMDLDLTSLPDEAQEMGRMAAEKVEKAQQDSGQLISDIDSQLGSMAHGNVKMVLKNVRIYIRRFAQKYQTAEEFQLGVNSIDKALTLLHDLYDHAEKCEEIKNLVDFMTKDDDLAARNSVKITDSELHKLVSNLEFYDQANVLLREYLKVMSAYEHRIFPFGSRCWNNRTTQQGFRNGVPSNLNEVVRLYRKEVNAVRVKVQNQKMTKIAGIESLFVRSFISDAVTSKPFYVWPNNIWKNSIKKLLAGEQVHLKADLDSVRDHPFFQGKSAIKFKAVEVTFKIGNSSRQGKLDEKLVHFQMQMEHSGVSTYGVENKNLVLIDRNQTYKYSIERTRNGRRMSENWHKYVADKEDDFTMSPYTWWSLQLVNTGGVPFTELKEFENEVDLELQGLGLYLDETLSSKETLKSLNLGGIYDIFERESDSVMPPEDTPDDTCGTF